MKVDVDKIWNACDFISDYRNEIEIISKIYFSDYKFTSEISEDIQCWTMDEILRAYEAIAIMTTYDSGFVEETAFGEPEFIVLTNEFYEASNICDASSYFIRPNKKKTFF